MSLLLRGGWRAQALYAVLFAAGAIWTHHRGAEPWYVACVVGASTCATTAWYSFLFKILGDAVRRHGVQGDVLEAVNLWKLGQRRARRMKAPEDGRVRR